MSSSVSLFNSYSVDQIGNLVSALFSSGRRLVSTTNSTALYVIHVTLLVSLHQVSSAQSSTPHSPELRNPTSVSRETVPPLSAPSVLQRY